MRRSLLTAMILLSWVFSQIQIKSADLLLVDNKASTLPVSVDKNAPEATIGAAKELIATCREIYTDEVFNSAEDCLKKAEAKVAGSPDRKYMQRVAFIRSGFDFTKLQLQIMNTMAKVRESQGKDIEAVKKAIELCEMRNTFFKNADVFAMRNSRWYHETRKLDDYMGPPSMAFREAAEIK